MAQSTSEHRESAELPRIVLLGTSVNKGKKGGQCITLEGGSTPSLWGRQGVTMVTKLGPSSFRSFRRTWLALRGP
jgi:hypothetical protein